MTDPGMIKIDVRGIKDLQEFLSKLPRGTIRAAIAAASEYFIGDEKHGLKHYPARVTHGKDNPYRWQSDKQRRAYFATDGFGGGIPSKRTGNLADKWVSHPTNDGYRMKIKNTSEYASYVQGDNQQRGHRADKWRKFAAIIQSNMNGAFRAANRAVEEYIRTHFK